MSLKKTCVGVVIALMFSFLLSSCNVLENKTQSNTMLIVESIKGIDQQGNLSSFLISNVSDIFSDFARVTIRAELLNPNKTPTVYNDVKLERYIVSYKRNDGKNEEGTDVPYRYESRLTEYIQAGTSITIDIIVVNYLAKKYPPLISLKNSSSLLEVDATIDFYGHDVAGKGVKTSGMLRIIFKSN
ncbi:MAG: hypothetical protein AB1410_03975 [Acidobacteriota bacterium]